MNSQKTESPEKEFNESVEVKPRGNSDERRSVHSMTVFENPMFGSDLMESVLDRNNLKRALRRVKSNKGAPGVDGMTVHQLPGYLKENWLLIKEQLLKGKYHPHAVKHVEIPKPGKKEKRQLGIPTCLDRFIQQAILQVLQSSWDETFSESCFGFQPGRSAHQAVRKDQDTIRWSISIWRNSEKSAVGDPKKRKFLGFPLPGADNRTGSKSQRLRLNGFVPESVKLQGRTEDEAYRSSSNS